MVSVNRLDKIARAALLYDLALFEKREDPESATGEYSELIKKANDLISDNEKKGSADFLRPIFSLLDDVRVQPAKHLELDGFRIPAREQTRSPLYPTVATNDEVGEREKLIGEFQRRSEYAKSLNALLLLWERYASALPASGFGGEISMYDAGLTRAAVAVCLSAHEDSKKKTPGEPEFLLAGGDISGVQTFIYALTSKGALKMLRARSFYVDLLLEHAVCDILDGLNLPRTQILYTGGGGFQLLLPNTPEAKAQIIKTRDSLNQELFRRHGGTLYLAIQGAPCDLRNEKGVGVAWRSVKDALDQEKSSKWKDVVGELGKEIVWERHDCQCESARGSGEICREEIWECDVCHVRLSVSVEASTADKKREREKASFGNPYRESYHKDADLDAVDETVHCCEVCYALYVWGNKLPKAFEMKGDIYAVDRKNIISERQDKKIKNYDGLPIGNLRYDIIGKSLSVPGEAVRHFLMNPDHGDGLSDEELRNPNYLRMIPYHVSSYAAFVDVDVNNKRFKTFEELAKDSKGANRIGALRMDVDHLGKIFSEGLRKDHEHRRDTLAHRAALSRAMTRFFKRHLDTILDERRTSPKSFSVTRRNAGKRDVTVVYAGGDDLFMVGGWSDLMEAVIDIRRAFVKYVCGHPGVTISGGFVVTNEHDPIYHLALETGLAEDAAKENKRSLRKEESNRSDSDAAGLKYDRDSLSLFYSSELAGDAEATEATEKRGAPETMKELMRREEKEKSRARIGSMTWKWDQIDSESGPFVPPKAESSGVSPGDLSVTGLLEGMMRDWTDSSQCPARWKTSSNFLYSLLHLESDYRSRGKIALPKLAYLLSRQGGASERGDGSERGIANWDGWKRVLHDPKAMELLRPVLYWMIYLKREER